MYSNGEEGTSLCLFDNCDRTAMKLLYKVRLLNYAIGGRFLFLLEDSSSTPLLGKFRTNQADFIACLL